MKKLFLLLVLGLAFGDSVKAEDNYPDDDIVTINKPEKNDNMMNSISYYGLGFYSYDGGENYSLSFGNYSFNSLGFGMNLRSNLKFSNNQNTYNADLLLNFSIGIYNNSDVAFMITPEIGPSLAWRYASDGKDKPKEKFYCDGFLGIKATVAYKKIVLSAGYHMWAPEWKFGKNEKADGFYAQLGVEL